MFSGVPVVVRENKMNNKSYNWMTGYYKFQLFKEIIIPTKPRNQKNNGTTTVNYDIYG